MNFCVNKNDVGFKALLDTKKIDEVTLSFVMERWFKDGNIGTPSLAEAIKIANEIKAKSTVTLSEVEQESQAVKNLRKRLQTRLNTLNDTLGTVKGMEYDKVKAKIEKFQNDLHQYDTYKNFMAMYRIGEEHLTYVAKQLEDPKKLSTADFKELHAYLDIYNNFTVNFIPEFLKQKQEVRTINPDTGDELVTMEYPKVYQGFLNLQVNAQNLQDKLNNLDKTEFVKVAQSLFHSGINVDSIFKGIKDIGSESMWLRPAALLGRQITTILHGINQLAMSKADQLKMKRDKEIKRLTDNLKLSSLFQSKGMDIFLEKDEKGNLTGNTITKYTPEYQKELDSIEKTHDFKAKKQWLKDNVKDFYFTNHVKYDTDTEEIVWDEEALSKERDNLISLYGDIEGNNIYEQVKEKAFIYIKDFQEIYEANKNKADGEKIINDWLEKNNPELFLGEKASGKFVSNAKFSHYTQRIPLQKHYSKEYLELANDSHASEFFNYWNNLITNYINSVPHSFIKQRGITKNFIPFVQKSLTAEYNESGLSSALESARKKLYNYGRASEQSDIIDDEHSFKDGSHEMSLPLKYLVNITRLDSDGQPVTDFKRKELDLSKVMSEINEDLAIYHYKNLFKDKFDLAVRAGKQIGETLGKDKANDDVEVLQGLKNLKEVLTSTEKAFYGVHIEKVDTTKKTLMTPEEKAEVEKLEAKFEAKKNKAIEHINKQTASEETKQAAIDEAIAKIDAQLESAKKRIVKNWSLGQIIRTAVKWMGIKTLGFNPLSSLNESTVGLTSLFIHAAGNEDFGAKDVFDSFRNAWSKKNMNLKHKFVVVAELGNDLSKGTFEKAASYLAEQTDMLLKGTTLIAKLKNINIQKLDGSYISLYDAYDENGELNPEEFSAETIADWTPDLSENFERNSFYRTCDHVKQLNVRIFGAMDRDYNLKINENTLGKVVKQFKTWLAEAIAVRFEAKKSDEILGRDVKGRWRSLFDLYQNNTTWKATKGLLTGTMDDLELVDGDLDAANIKKDMIELYIILGTTTIMYALAHAIAGDDDDEKSLAFYFTVNWLGRVQQDLLYYINPKEASKITENLIPIFRIYQDADNVMGAVYDNITGEGEIKDGIYKGMNKLNKAIPQALPVSTQMLRLYGYFNQEMVK